MNIEILTLHALQNPGSAWQAYALQAYLAPRHNAEIIDYRPPYLLSEGKPLRYLAKRILHGVAYWRRQRKFERFIQSCMKLSARFTSARQLERAQWRADVFMTGSDQLWNPDFPCGRDPAFYLSFVKNARKMAYSTSVGKKDLDAGTRRVLTEKLSDFDAISVREKSTARQLGELLHRDVAWVCDPVFLLSKEAYEPFARGTRQVDGPYALVYLSKASPALDRVVEYYKAKGLRIVLGGGVTRRCQCDLHLKDMGPEDFVGLISRAEVVVSSSFHATAFCHIFHRPFVTFVPSKNGERITSLLEESGLTDHATSHSSVPDSARFDSPIDWNKVDCNLENYIRNSKSFLESHL